MTAVTFDFFQDLQSPNNALISLPMYLITHIFVHRLRINYIQSKCGRKNRREKKQKCRKLIVFIELAVEITLFLDTIHFCDSYYLEARFAPLLLHFTSPVQWIVPTFWLFLGGGKLCSVILDFFNLDFRAS